MSLFESRKKIQERIVKLDERITQATQASDKTGVETYTYTKMELQEWEKELQELIKIAETRLEYHEKDFKQAHAPLALFEIKGRIEEVCLVLGRKAEGNYRLNHREW